MYEYKIHVLARDINFDPNYKNVVQFFDPITKTKDYTGVFTNDELTFNASEETINFDPQDAINANAVLSITGNYVFQQFGVASLTIQDALNRQYAIIQEQLKDDETEAVLSTKLYFYFIKNAIIKNEDTIKYILEIDAFTTHPLFSDIDVEKTLISRAHVNRYTNTSKLANAKFNLNSEFLETGEEIEFKYKKYQAESIDIDFDKYGVSIEKDPAGDTLTNAEEIILKAIKNTMWCYVFFRTSDNVSNVAVYHTDPAQKFLPTYYDIEFYVGKDTTDPTLINPINALANKEDDPKIYNAYISPFSPFGSNKINTCNLLYNYNSLSGKLKIYFIWTEENLYIPTRKRYDVATYEKLEFQNNYDGFGLVFRFYTSYNKLLSYFQKEDLQLFNDSKNLTATSLTNFWLNEAEPKTKIKQAFNEYTLKTILDNSELKLDLTQLKTNKLTIKLVNSFNFASNGEIYLGVNTLNENNLEIRTKTKYTPMIFSDKYKEFKLTNNNYALTSLALPLFISGVNSTASGMANPHDPTGIQSFTNFATGNFTRIVNYFANIDNMENTPDTIKMKGYNPDIDAYVENSAVYIEHKTLKDTEMAQANLYFYEFGYSINKFDSVENYFTRRDFNYIQLENCEKDLHALLNPNILKIVIDALNSGVRFWTKTKYINSKFKYTTLNLESSLT